MDPEAALYRTRAVTLHAMRALSCRFVLLHPIFLLTSSKLPKKDCGNGNSTSNCFRPFSFTSRDRFKDRTNRAKGKTQRENTNMMHLVVCKMMVSQGESTKITHRRDPSFFVYARKCLANLPRDPACADNSNNAGNALCASSTLNPATLLDLMFNLLMQGALLQDPASSYQGPLRDPSC